MTFYLMVLSLVRTVLWALKTVFVIGPLLLLGWIRRAIKAASKSIIVFVARADAMRRLSKLSFIHNLLIIKPSTRALIVVIDPELNAPDDNESLSAVRKIIYEQLAKAGCDRTEVIILYNTATVSIVN